MHSIKTFQWAQEELGKFLTKKLSGEKMNEALTKRAQRLCDKWFKELKQPIVMQAEGMLIVGAELAFGLGTIKVKKWHTAFAQDRFEIAKVVPDHIALGYVGNEQLYIANVNDVPHLCARDTPFNVERWAVYMGLIPVKNSPLFHALERARMLGYLDHLKGIK